MSESASTLFSIADAGEFGSRGFILSVKRCPLGTLESPLIVCGLPDTPCGLSKRGKDTESDVPTGREEILSFCFKESPHPFVFWNVLPVSVLYDVQSISLPVQWLF